MINESKKPNCGDQDRKGSYSRTRTRTAGRGTIPLRRNQASDIVHGGREDSSRTTGRLPCYERRQGAMFGPYQLPFLSVIGCKSRTRPPDLLLLLRACSFLSILEDTMNIHSLQIKRSDYTALTARETGNPLVEDYLPELISEMKRQGATVVICDDLTGAPVFEV